jgi:hypothetical protein
MNKRHFLRDIAALVRDVRAQIQPAYRASEDDTQPGIQLTVATDDAFSMWSFQTGDNSYTGGAYGLPHWAVVAVYRDSNSFDVARDIYQQLQELLP